MNRRSARALISCLLLLVAGSGCNEAAKRAATSGAAKQAPAGGPSQQSVAAVPASANPQADMSRLVGVWEGTGQTTHILGNQRIQATSTTRPLVFEFRADGTMTIPWDERMLHPYATGTWKVVTSNPKELTITIQPHVVSFSASSASTTVRTQTNNTVTVNNQAQSASSTSAKAQEEAWTVLFDNPNRIAMAPVNAPRDFVTLDKKR